MKFFPLAIALSFVGFSLATPASAAYPDRPIKMVVAWPAGGALITSHA